MFDEATIIVHGDHGSRIVLVAPKPTTVELFSESDLTDTYSVLFAARSHGLSQEYELKLRSLQAVFAELFLDRPFSNEHKDVFLDSLTGSDTRAFSSY